MLTLENGETRRISELPVFLWTAFASVAAYAWVYIVYKVWTPVVFVEETPRRIVLQARRGVGVGAAPRHVGGQPCPTAPLAVTE